jgi:hypothetical protein
MPSVPLFDLARKHLPLSSLGFTEFETDFLGGLLLAWHRPDGLRLNLLRHHRPYMVTWLGNGFSMSLEVEGSGHASPFEGGFYFLLSDEEWARAREIHDQVLQSLPVPGPDSGLMDVEIEGIRDDRAQLEKPWRRNHETRFRYASRQDAVRWLKFVAEVLPACIERFRAGIAPGLSTSP